MSKRYSVVDRQASVAAELRRPSTAVNPRYVVVDLVEHCVVDEFATKRVALDTARDMNRSLIVDAPDDAAHHNH